MHHTTGFSKDEVTELAARVRAAVTPGDEQWPPILGLFRSVVVTLTYLRRNRVQAEIGEAFAVSQSTISRAVTALTPLLAQVLTEFVPTVADLDPRASYLVDGTLLTCWSWKGHRELYSGKHHTTGLNVQVACTPSGRLAWISAPVDGCRHDSAAIADSAVLATLDPALCVGDKGYIGKGMITPVRKPPRGKLRDDQRDFNKTVNALRAVVEHVISHLKNWAILHTDYRRPLNTFKTTIAAVTALHFYRLP